MNSFDNELDCQSILRFPLKELWWFVVICHAFSIHNSLCCCIKTWSCFYHTPSSMISNFCHNFLLCNFDIVTMNWFSMNQTHSVKISTVQFVFDHYFSIEPQFSFYFIPYARLYHQLFHLHVYLTSLFRSLNLFRHWHSMQQCNRFTMMLFIWLWSFTTDDIYHSMKIILNDQQL